MTKVCGFCGSLFVPRSYRHIYCSRQCSQKGTYRRRHPGSDDPVKLSDKDIELCKQRSFENCCLHFRDDLLKIHQGNPGEAKLNPQQRRNMKEYGIIIAKKSGFRQPVRLTKRAIKFLGFSKKEHEKHV